MAPPEDAGPSGEHRALVAVTDALGLSAPATELVRAISKGIGNFSEAWLRRRNARADLDIYEEWKASLVNIDELPSSFEFSIDDRAAIRLKDEIRQKQFNRERVAVEAIEDYRGSEARDRGESGGESFDADWLNFYWQAAEQVSSRDMQSLWGRVLSRQASGERKYQLRTLDFLRTLSRSEAADITDLAGVAVQLDCQWGTGTGVLSRLGQIGHEIHDGELSDINERIRGFVRTANEGHLGSIGFFIESGWAYEFVVDRPDESFDCPKSRS